MMKLKKMDLRYVGVVITLFATVMPAFSYAGFYVIPVVTEKEVVREICHGNTAVGSRAFILDIGNLDHVHLRAGNIYPSSSGYLVEITGNDSYSVWYNKGDSFFVAPKLLPNPEYGVKGTFYYLSSGKKVYAHFL